MVLAAGAGTGTGVADAGAATGGGGIVGEAGAAGGGIAGTGAEGGGGLAGGACCAGEDPGASEAARSATRRVNWRKARGRTRGRGETDKGPGRFMPSGVDAAKRHDLRG